MTTPSAPFSSVTRRQAIGMLGALSLPWENLLAQTTAPSTTGVSASPSQNALPAKPDLPNFHDTFAWIAREHAPRLSFLDARWRDLAAWKDAVRPVFRQHLSFSPTPAPLAADAIEREERDDFTIETVHIHAAPTYKIPARILTPKNRPAGKRLPAVVALHCHSGRYTWGHEKVLSSPRDSEMLVEFRNGTYGRPWGEHLVRRGYVVLIADAFYFGERRLRAEDLEATRVFGEVRERWGDIGKQPAGTRDWTGAVNRVCGFYENHTAKTILATGATWPGLLVWDDMRTVDYLASRADVDPARLGCVGLSIGGLRAAHLIAADARLKTAVVTGWMTEFAQQIRNHARHTWMAFVPGLYRSLDLPDAAALHAPGALLVQQCRQDTLYPLKAMEDAVAKLTRIYAKAGIPEKFRGTFYDEPHSFKPAMQDEAFAWLDKWL